MGRINQLAEKTTLNSTDVIAVDAGAGGNTNKMTGANLAGQLKTLGNYQEKLTFDSAPTAGSTNPVTSGGVKTALDGKQNTLTFDTTPTAGSTNPVTSGGVATAIQQSMASDWGNLNSYLSSLESGANTLITYAGKMRTITFQGVARSHAEDETLMTLPQEHRPLIQGNNYFEGNIGGTSVVIAINGSTGKVSIFTINGATSLARVYFSATYMAQ